MCTCIYETTRSCFYTLFASDRVPGRFLEAPGRFPEGLLEASPGSSRKVPGRFCEARCRGGFPEAMVRKIYLCKNICNICYIIYICYIIFYIFILYLDFRDYMLYLLYYTLYLLYYMLNVLYYMFCVL